MGHHKDDDELMMTPSMIALAERKKRQESLV